MLNKPLQPTPQAEKEEERRKKKEEDGEDEEDKEEEEDEDEEEEVRPRLDKRRGYNAIGIVLGLATNCAARASCPAVLGTAARPTPTLRIIISPKRGAPFRQ